MFTLILKLTFDVIPKRFFRFISCQANAYITFFRLGFYFIFIRTYKIIKVGNNNNPVF